MENQEWYIQAFGEWYPIVYQHRDKKEAQEQVEFACSILKQRKNSRVLDLCCGYGRHLIFLAEKFDFTVGFDLSLYLLQQARKLIGSKTFLVRGDVRYLPFSPCSFDVVLSFFTSFGYFAEDKENYRQIEQIANVLKVGGKFLFDYLNPQQVEKIKDIRTEKKYKSYIIKEKRSYDKENKKLIKNVIIYSDETQVEKSYTEIVRVYSLDELVKMFASCNLIVKYLYGSYKKEEYKVESPRLILIGEKNE